MSEADVGGVMYGRMRCDGVRREGFVRVEGE